MEILCPSALTESAKILCCQCGALIEANPSNMCVACIRTHVDITEGIPKQSTLYFCKGCDRYLQPPSQWIKASLESRELLGLCLQRLKGLNKVRLVDAGFVWTEPHSKRIKVKLTIQSEVFGGTILQQVFIVEFTVNGQFCEDCHKAEAKDFWKVLVQVRQKVDHKKTLYYLEQLILKHRAHENTLSIKPCHEGLDFYYANEGSARKMVDFLQSVVPVKYQMSKTLISQDIHSNIFNYKYTYIVEIAPVCKDSIVCLPKKLAHNLGGIGQLCIIHRINNTIHLINPFSAQTAEVQTHVYWRHPFTAIAGTKQLIEYIVMDIEPVLNHERITFSGQGHISTKHELADIWVVKATDLGLNDNPIHCKTHLGHLLRPGDSVLGFDLLNSNVNDSNFESLKKDYIPDVLLVKKHFPDKALRNRRRIWKLKHLDVEDKSSVNRDYVDFLEDLEEDPGLRQNIAIYKDTKKIEQRKLVAQETEEVPEIGLEEMLEDLHIGTDATGEEGAAMLE
ncbi:60S ribosomal export protein NMD3-like [Artemia franciscana]|uniref:60S ribosomal export protein NMD3 n=1 Tax=Artemia franciscana TaxID=6661 RepID=A0AA88IRW0_ARTSF|nr:hypothetical protein QYM36_000243 [Artemia franciscana]